MESLKRPEMIISVATNTVLVGTIIYFYRQENLLQEELSVLKDNLATTIKKVQDMQKDTQVNGQHILDIANAIRQLNEV